MLDIASVLLRLKFKIFIKLIPELYGIVADIHNITLQVGTALFIFF